MFLRNAQQRNVITQARQLLLAEAQAALQADQFRVAIDLYRQFLAEEPGHLAAQKGLQEATVELELANQYEVGVQALQAQHVSQALAVLSDLEQKAPNYRDTQRLLAQIQATQEVDQHLARAETAYAAQQWPTAIQEYETLRQLDMLYAADIVTPHLAVAYTQAGQQLVAQRPNQAADLKLAQTYFQKALALSPDPSTQTESNLLTAYLAGVQALQPESAGQAITALEPVYQTRPAYLGGYLAEQLYAAYLLAGDQATASGDSQSALDYYEKAAALPVGDPQEALQRAQALALALVTPTATPLPPAPVDAPPPAPPTATPLPAPQGLDAFQGWIAFRSNRDGDTAIYLMQPDGSQQQRAPGAAADQFEQFYSRQQWTSDGIRLLYVASPPGRSDTNLFIVQTDLPAGAARDTMICDFILM
jgi:hypothetical protein